MMKYLSVIGLLLVVGAHWTAAGPRAWCFEDVKWMQGSVINNLLRGSLFPGGAVVRTPDGTLKKSKNFDGTESELKIIETEALDDEKYRCSKYDNNVKLGGLTYTCIPNWSTRDPFPILRFEELGKNGLLSRTGKGRKTLVCSKIPSMVTCGIFVGRDGMQLERAKDFISETVGMIKIQNENCLLEPER